MAQLRQDYPQFQARQAEIIAINPEDQALVAAYWEGKDLPFIGVPDPEHAVANRFGQQFSLLRLGRLPAMVILDKQGRLAWRHDGALMNDIPDNTAILAELERLNAAAPEAGTPQAHSR